jgi:hypothetical protein
MIEEIGARTGRPTPGGRLPAIRLSFSLTPWRAAWMSVPHAGGPVHGRLDRERDLALDFPRRHAVGFGEDGDGGRGEVRKDVDGHAEGDEGADAEQQDSERQNRRAVAEGALDDRVHHGGSP